VDYFMDGNKPEASHKSKAVAQAMADALSNGVGPSQFSIKEEPYPNQTQLFGVWF
jgi:hypothetical protein